ncbi:MAG: hypothetical protein FWD71_22855 [Oscillospiraceae bacterium]|nr:hypothetical protein [Oscillospiraceae bacterium]
MGKLYVPVRLYVDETGKVTPQEIKAGYDDEWVKVEKVTDSHRRASLVAGAVGIRYTCVVNINETQRNIYLFDEEGKWFIEIDDDY